MGACRPPPPPRQLAENCAYVSAIKSKGSMEGFSTPILKRKNVRNWGCPSEVKCLPNTLQALGFIPSPTQQLKPSKEIRGENGQHPRGLWITSLIPPVSLENLTFSGCRWNSQKVVPQQREIISLRLNVFPTHLLCDINQIQKDETIPR